MTTAKNSLPPHHHEADPIWTTIDGTRRLSGLGRSKIYELIDEKILESVKVGSRRLVSVASIRALGDRPA